MLAVVGVGCGMPFDDPDVDSGDIHDETEPNDGSDEAEQTGFTLDGSTWFEVRGIFDNDTDTDYYRVDLDGQDHIDLVTYREYEGEEQQYNLMFPVNVNEYSQDDSLGVQNLLAAAGWGVDLESDTSYVLLKVSGQEADEGFAPYTNSKPYRVQFR
jgi:hypothetical protein